MVQSLQRANAFIGVQCHKASQKVDFKLVESLCVFCHRHTFELRECRFEVFELQCVGPVVLIRRSEYFEYFENLIDLTVSHEKRSSLDHLCKDASC